jgi:hypothetical protein
MCVGLLFAAKCRRPQFVPVAGISDTEDGLIYEEWVPISFSCRFTCNADVLRFACHPWDSDGYALNNEAYLIVHENQLRRKVDHENLQVKYMSNYCERWYGNILVVKFVQDQSKEWRVADLCQDDMMQINMQILK